MYVGKAWKVVLYVEVVSYYICSMACTHGHGVAGRPILTSLVVGQQTVV